MAFRTFFSSVLVFSLALTSAIASVHAEGRPTLRQRVAQSRIERARTRVNSTSEKLAVARQRLGEARRAETARVWPLQAERAELASLMRDSEYLRLPEARVTGARIRQLDQEIGGYARRLSWRRNRLGNRDGELVLDTESSPLGTALNATARLGLSGSTGFLAAAIEGLRIMGTGHTSISTYLSPVFVAAAWWFPIGRRFVLRPNGLRNAIREYDAAERAHGKAEADLILAEEGYRL